MLCIKFAVKLLRMLPNCSSKAASNKKYMFVFREFVTLAVFASFHMPIPKLMPTAPNFTKFSTSSGVLPIPTEIQ